MSDSSLYFDRLHRLLHMEADAEKQQAVARMARRSDDSAENSSETLVDLQVRDEDTTVGGYVLVTLGKRQQNRPLPWHNLNSGRPILLTQTDADEPQAWRGIVSKLTRRTIEVALRGWAESGDPAGTFRLDAAPDDVARRRQETAVDAMRTATAGRRRDLREVLLGNRSPAFGPIPPLDPLDEMLDETQRTAVAFALAADDLAIIHGPPGTGKTTAVVEFIRQAIRRGENVLACAPSNLAVDNMLEKLIAADENAVRIGHPARVTAELRDYTLDGRAMAHDDVQLAQKYTREAHALFRRANRWTRAKPAPGEKRGMRQEAKSLLHEARQLEDAAIEQILDRAAVVCSTLTGLSDRLLGDRTYDWVVIDEAAQATQPAALIPWRRCKRVLLAGDHCQLPPTVISTKAAAEGFGVSLMERMMDIHPPQTIARRLDVQYRMHADIMNFSSAEFYDGDLRAHPTVAAHLLTDFPAVDARPLTAQPITYIDTAGAGYDEEEDDDSFSRRNRPEAKLVVQQVEGLLDAGVRAADIGIITPYAAQVKLLYELITDEAIEINSVDGFQGREKEVIIFGMVRANPYADIGFLADTRRTNVALTRARRKLIVIGDSATVTAHDFYGRMVTYFESVDAYQSVWELGVM